MITWIKLPPLELEDIKLVDPEEEVKPNETIVGVLPGDLKRLYSYRSLMVEKGMRLEVDYELATKDEKGELEALLSETRQKVKAVDLLLWIGVNDEFGLWDKDTVGLRKGFQVVWSEGDDSPPDIGDILRHIRGG